MKRVNIVCPQCGFSRRLPEDRQLGEVVIATCPQCACRFRFSIRDGVLAILDSSQQAAAKNGGFRADKLQGNYSDLPPEASISGREVPKVSKGFPQDGRRIADKAQANDQDEEDIRETARRAYAREAARFSQAERGEEHQDDIQQASSSNPWDNAPASGGWLQAFYQTVLYVMFAAPRFFVSLRSHASQLRPLSFYLVVCVIQTVVERVWASVFMSALAPSAATDPQLENLLAMLAPRSDFALGLLVRCGLLVLQLYVFAALMYLAYRIVAREQTSFSLVFQIMAYSSAPALLCVVPALGSLAGMVWGLACLAVGCKVALRLNWAQTLFGFVPLMLVFGPVLLQVITVLQG